MTVCVAAHCVQENSFVAVVDKMLSATDISADGLAIKFSALGGKWMGMWSANDLSPVSSIIRAVRDTLAPTQVNETLEDVAGAFRAAFRAEKRKKIDSGILPIGLTLEEFYQKGLKVLGPEIFGRTYSQIDAVALEVSFLVCGFSGDTPHLFTFGDHGERNYDLIQFWAIGSGTNNAIGSLFNLKTPVRFLDLNSVIYRVCEAKFFAETAQGVGKETSILVLKSNGDRFLLSDDHLQEIRKIWEATSTRPLPSGAQEAVAKAVEEVLREEEGETKQSVPGTTEPEP